MIVKCKAFAWLIHCGVILVRSLSSAGLFRPSGPVYWHETSESASVSQKQPEFSWISSGSRTLGLSLSPVMLQAGFSTRCPMFRLVRGVATSAILCHKVPVFSLPLAGSLWHKG